MQIHKMLGLRRKQGDVGVEIEVEGNRLPKDGLLHWRVERDGSLRGESAEYVLRNPLSLGGLDVALAELKQAYAEKNSVINQSVRTGIHVHVNVQELTVNQLFNLVAIYFIVEKQLLNWCGKTRVGNLFCLGVSNAEGLLHYIKNSITAKDLEVLHTDDIRYSSLNLKAVCEYGSVEFRSMASTDDFERVRDWAHTLVRMRDVAKLYENPLGVVEDYLLSPEKFVVGVLGEQYKKFECPDMYNGWEDGLRYSNDLAHMSDWKEVKMRDIGGLLFPDDGVIYDEPKEDI